MPNTLARSSTDNAALISTQLAANRVRFGAKSARFGPGPRLQPSEGLGEPSQTVRALLAMNAALVASNLALLAAIERYEMTTGAGARNLHNARVAKSGVPNGAKLRLVLPERPDAVEPSPTVSSASMLAMLTARQKQILHLVLAGHPSKNIAADLNISQRTVENHRAAIMRRTGATSLPALARMAVGADGSADCKAALPNDS